MNITFSRNHDGDPLVLVDGKVEAIAKNCDGWDYVKWHVASFSVAAVVSPGAGAVLDERLRQVGQLGWTADHDNREHDAGDLAGAGVAYAIHMIESVWPEFQGDPPRIFDPAPSLYWKWAIEWWKPKDARSNLVRAAALIIAEIDRLDREPAAIRQGREDRDEIRRMQRVALEASNCLHSNEDRKPHWVFNHLVRLLELDTCVRFYPTESDIAAACRPIEQLQTAGFFTDDPNNLDGSFWMAAAGEESERERFFSRARVAFKELDAVLITIFEDRTEPAAEEQT